MKLAFRVLLISLFVFSSTAYAATVKVVKKKRVLIDLEGDTAEKGQLFYVMSSSGKKRAILRVQKVKGGKAIARIVKGKASKGNSVVPRGSKGATKTSSKTAASSFKPQSYWGVQAVFMAHSWEAKILQGDNVTLSDSKPTGSAFQVSAHYDYPVFNKLWFRGILGYESLDVKSTEQVCSSAACVAKIGSIALTPSARYLFSLGKIRPWLGAGVAFLFSISKDSNFLNTTSSNYAPFSLGVDWVLSSGNIVSVSGRYDRFADSSTVKASAVGAQLDFSFPF